MDLWSRNYLKVIACYLNETNVLYLMIHAFVSWQHFLVKLLFIYFLLLVAILAQSSANKDLRSHTRHEIYEDYEIDNIKEYEIKFYKK